MHVVLSGYYGFDNVGDEAILYSIIRALRNLQENVEITVLSNNPKATEETYDVQAVDRWNLTAVNTCIRNADGLISGGGSLLQDKTGMRSIPYYTGIMRIAIRNKKPVFVYAQGMGPIHRKLGKWLTKRTLNKTDMLTVRDDDSKELLMQIGVKKPITVVPDPVLGLDSSNFESNWLNEQEQELALGDSFLTVSVRDWPSEEPFKKRIADCLDQFARNGYGIVFIPMHGEHDAITSREVADMMQEKSYVSPADDKIEEKIAIIQNSSLLIGMRLHSLIFAAVSTVPFIALSYDPKIDAFASICDQPVAGHVEADNWNAQTLVDKGTEMLENYATEKAKLQDKVQVLQQNAKKTTEMVIQLLEKNS